MADQAYEKLPCQLSVAEKDAKADELAREIERLGALELERSLHATRLAKLVKDSDRKIRELGSEIRTGIEHRLIAVVNQVRGPHMITIRTDTHKQIRARPLEPHERQRDLFVPPGPGDEEDGDEEDGGETSTH